MCGGGPDLPPQEQTPAQAREQADAEATQSANAKAAAARLAKQRQSLLASGAQGNADPVATSSVLALGKDKLGA